SIRRSSPGTSGWRFNCFVLVISHPSKTLFRRFIAFYPLQLPYVITPQFDNSERILWGIIRSFLFYSCVTQIFVKWSYPEDNKAAVFGNNCVEPPGNGLFILGCICGLNDQFIIAFLYINSIN